MIDLQRKTPAEELNGPESRKHKSSTGAENKRGAKENKRKKRTRLIVEAVIIAGFAECVVVLDFTSRGEAEETAASRVLQALSEGLIAADLDIADRAAGCLHGLLEVSTGKLGDGVLLIHILVVHCDILTGGLAGLGLLDIERNGLLDGELDGTLGHETKIGTRETVGLAGDERHIDVVGDGGLTELGPEDTLTGSLVGQGNVDEGVKTARTDKGSIELLRTVGGTDDEDVLLRGHTIHLCFEC